MVALKDGGPFYQVYLVNVLGSSVLSRLLDFDFDKNPMVSKNVFLQLLHFYSIFLAFQSKNEGWHFVKTNLSNVIISAVFLHEFIY